MKINTKEEQVVEEEEMKLTQEQIKVLEGFKDDAFQQYWDYINENLEEVLHNPYIDNDNEYTDEDKYNEFLELCYEQLEIK